MSIRIEPGCRFVSQGTYRSMRRSTKQVAVWNALSNLPNPEDRLAVAKILSAINETPQDLTAAVWLKEAGPAVLGGLSFGCPVLSQRLSEACDDRLSVLPEDLSIRSWEPDGSRTCPVCSTWYLKATSGRKGKRRWYRTCGNPDCIQTYTAQRKAEGFEAWQERNYVSVSCEVCEFVFKVRPGQADRTKPKHLRRTCSEDCRRELISRTKRRNRQGEDGRAVLQLED